jgi:PAS domain S-box-containing protein
VDPTTIPPWLEASAPLLTDPVMLDALLDASSTPTCILDLALRFNRFNRAFAELALSRWGVALKPGIALADVMPEGEYRDATLEEARTAMMGTPQGRDEWMEVKDGRRTLRKISTTPVRGENGAVVGVMVTALELPASAVITMGSGPDYRRLFTEAPHGMLLVKHDGTIVEGNGRVAKFLGMTSEKLAGLNIRDITFPEDRGLTPMSALVRGSIAQFEVEKRYLRADGKAVRGRVTAIRLPGEPALVLGVIDDLENTPARIDADPEADRRGNAIFRGQSGAVALISRQGIILEANRALADLQGRTRAQVLGLSISEFDVGRTPAELAECLAQAFERPVVLSSIHRRADGIDFPVEISVGPISSCGQLLLCCEVRDVTKEQRLEQERATSADRYRILVERGPVVTYSFSTTRGGLSYSPQAEALLGHTPQRLVKAPFTWLEAIHPDDRPTVDAALAALEQNDGFDFEVRLRHKDGTWRWVREWSGSIERMGEEVIVNGQAIDLTPLREKEMQFQRMVESAPDLLYRWVPDPSPRFEYISPSVRQILGYAPEELMETPRRLMDRIHPDDAALVKAITGTEASTTTPLRIRVLHKDGRVVWLEVRRTVLRDTQGRAVAMEGIARDITAQVTTEQRLQMMGSALEQAAEAAIVTDRSGMIIQVNAAFERITGYKEDEVVGRNPRLLQSGKQDGEYYLELWRTLTSGQVWRGTIVNQRKNGSHYTAEVVITPIKDAAGEIVHYVALQRDITRERVLDEALRQAQKMEAIGQVTGGVAHDFNNLLTVILANANLIEPELVPLSEAATWLQEIVSAAQHGSGMVRQLLAFGRREILTPRPLQLGEEFTTFIPILRRVMNENIEVSFAGGDRSWARVDRTAFEQILLNLATNARDAMPGGGRVAVRIAQRAISTEQAAGSVGELTPGEFATLSFEDSGAGMDAATLKRVFEPFYTTKPVGKGTGLGLPMVYGLMQQHGGWVEITSEPGVGTKVSLGFPIIEAPAASPIREVQPGIPRQRAGKGELILVVEDEDSLRRVAARTLEREGFKVLTAPDGESGWAQWNEHGDAIALILTDAVMPRLSGPGLIRRLRGSGSAVPVILMSGYSEESFEDALMKDVPVVAKPWSGEVLASRIRATLDGSVDG